MDYKPLVKDLLSKIQIDTDSKQVIIDNLDHQPEPYPEIVFKMLTSETDEEYVKNENKLKLFKIQKYKYIQNLISQIHIKYNQAMEEIDKYKEEENMEEIENILQKI